MNNFTYSFSNTSQLNYFNLGSGAPVLLVHGTGFDSTIWIRSAGYLSSRFTVYAIDRNGFGKSVSKSTELNNYSIKQAEDILKFIEYDIGRPAIVAGWSSGALMALRAAIMDKKDLIKQIISVEAPYLSSSDNDLSSILKFIRMIFLQMRGRYQKATEIFLRIILEKSDHSNSFDFLDKAILDSIRINAAASLKEIKTRTGEDIDKKMLRSLKIPVDFITGDLSPRFIRKSNNRMAEIFPSGKWLHIKNGGHLSLYECPDEFSRKLAALTGDKI